MKGLTSVAWVLRKAQEKITEIDEDRIVKANAYLDSMIREEKRFLWFVTQEGIPTREAALEYMNATKNEEFGKSLARYWHKEYYQRELKSRGSQYNHCLKLKRACQELSAQGITDVWCTEADIWNLTT